VRHQRLVQRHVSLQERLEQLQATRVQHVALQKELQESLAKSRERLTRLTSLVLLEGGGEEEEEDNGDSDDTKSSEAQPKPETEETIRNEEATIDEAFFAVGDKDETTNEQSNDNLLSTSLVDMHTLETLEEFNRHHTTHPMGLLSFLPVLGRPHLERILLLAIREANALDEREDASRRCLLWNTCLDFLCLSRRQTVLAHHSGSEQEQPQQESDPEQEPLDPNVSLCPYELAGVCADGLCPYQHTSKQTLSRERLPLPPLSLLRPKKDKVGTATSKDHIQKAKDVSSEEGGVTATKDTAMDDDDSSVVVEETETNSAFNEDFISLPAATAEDDEDDDDGEQFEASKEDNEDPIITAYRKGTLSIPTWSFWWGGSMDGNNSSITEILQKVGDISVEESTLKCSTEGGVVQGLEWLGGVLDMCRLAIHAGRFDITRSLLELASKRIDRTYQPEFYQAATKQLALLENAAFLYDSQPHSLFHSSFAVQVSLALLSEYVLAVENTKQKDEQWQESAASFKDIAMECTSTFLSQQQPEPAGISNDLVDEFRNMLSNSVDDWDDSCLSQGKLSLLRFGDLHLSMLWAQRTFHAESPYLHSLHQIDDQVLKPCWSLVSSWIRSLKQEARHWEGLKATILMGYAMIGCLERFAAHVNHGEDKLGASLTAALTTVDATIYRILKGLSNQLSDVPLIDLILAPLFSASVATATFLRQYSVVQHRLEALLASDSKSSKVRKGPLVTRYSELLWSQLLHLRMSLPIESAPEPKKGKKGYYWEPSRTAQEDNKLLLDRIARLGVRVHHVTLEGDWILAKVMSNETPPPSVQIDSNKVKSFQKLSSGVLRRLFSNEKDDDHELLEAWHLCNVRLAPRDNGRGRPHTPFVSTLPRSLLLAGHSLQSLRLPRCHLSILPASFGLYFPNLTVRVMLWAHYIISTIL
jgi:hypothetical protein